MAQFLQEGLRLDQVIELREKTEKVSQFLNERLRGHLEVLRPLIAPHRLFGRHTRGAPGEDVPGSESARRKLAEQYQAICAKPFALTADLPHNAVDDLDGRLELYAWEYDHDAKTTANEVRSITISTPSKSVLTYKSAYTLSEFRAAVGGKGDRRQSDIQEFLVAALAIKAMLERFSGIIQLFNDLRYDVEVKNCPDLGELPLVIIASGIPSFRPIDEIILATTRLSGVPAFRELIDVEAVDQMKDPLRSKIEKILRDP